MFEGLALEIKAVAHLDAAGLVDDELTEAVVELGRLEGQLAAARNRLLGEWDGRGVWRADGARSGAAALSTRTREPKAECGSRLWLERSLRSLPVARAAWRAGDLTIAHVRLLARARNQRTAVDLERDEAMLVHQAMTLSFADFARALEYWTMHADPDGADQSDVERRARRRVSLDRTLSGTWSGSMLLDPISGEIVSEELFRLERALFEADWAEATERLGREPVVVELARTSDQRRADALVEMARRSATAPADGKAPPPLFQVLIGNDALSHLLQLASGQVLPPSALLPWLSGADLERYLFEGQRQRVIRVSYKRTFEGSLRDLIKVRDRFCYHRTCDEPAHRCQIDHVEPWGAGGITAQENGRVACKFHNLLRQRSAAPP
ncbi:MAG TPA: DUF222 domain-containing protein [Acidimicrobiales bacterium]|nr:DUF222 domain-containing protein [Acidimicrobiales bacterium]